MKMYTVYTQPKSRYQEKGWQGASRIQFDYIDAAVLYNDFKMDGIAMKIVNNETKEILYSKNV